MRLSFLAAAVGLLCSPAILPAAELKFVTEDSGDIAVLIDGNLFTRYVVSDEKTNKTYFWPLIGPTGKEVTRAYPMEDRKDEKQDHPHHRSLWFGLQEADGMNTWHESLTFGGDPKKLKTTGTQVHTELVKAEANGNQATLVTTTEHRSPDGEVFLKDERTVEFTVREDGARVIDFELVLIGVKDSILIKGKKDSGFNLRVAHSMTVDAKKGGGILNSHGDKDKDTWGKRAAWVDFFGPVEGDVVGIAMLNHPESFRHPTPWHARTYGLFTANPFALKEVGGEKESGDFHLKKDGKVPPPAPHHPPPRRSRIRENQRRVGGLRGEREGVGEGRTLFNPARTSPA